MNNLERRIQDLEDSISEAEHSRLVLINIVDASIEGSQGAKPGFALIADKIGKPAITVWHNPGETLRDFENRIQTYKQELTT